jgi:hypothetical protein
VQGHSERERRAAWPGAGLSGEWCCDEREKLGEKTRGKSSGKKRGQPMAALVFDA